LTRSIML